MNCRRLARRVKNGEMHWDALLLESPLELALRNNLEHWVRAHGTGLFPGGPKFPETSVRWRN